MEEREKTVEAESAKVNAGVCTVQNKVKLIRDGEVVKGENGKPVTFTQTFTMTSAKDAPLFSFTIGEGEEQNKLGSVLSDGSNFFLRVSDEVLANLPNKDNILTLDGKQHMLLLSPFEDGKSPIVVDSKSGEITVEIQAKDGSTPYSCKFTATGVEFVYNGEKTSYKPSDDTQIIDVQMSSSAFEGMISRDNNLISHASIERAGKIPEGSRLSMAAKDIPPFMLGAYLETVNDTESESIMGTAKINSAGLSTFALRLPDNANSQSFKNYYFIRDPEDNKCYLYNNGKLAQITSDREYFYRCYDNGQKGEEKALTSAEMVVKLGSRHNSIALPLASDNKGIPTKLASALQNLHGFIGTQPHTSKQLDASKHETLFASNGFTLTADGADSTETKPVTPEIKGYDYEVEEQAEQVANSPAAAKAEKTSNKKASKSDNKDKKDKNDREVKGPKFNPQWGQVALMMGIFLMMISVLLGPIGMAIMFPLGMTIGIGGIWYYTNASRLSDPYNKIKRYFIEPLYEMQKEKDAEREAYLENAREHMGAESQFGIAAQEMFENPFMQVFETLGAGDETLQAQMIAEFLSEDNLDKRQDFAKALEEYMGKTFTDYEDEHGNKITVEMQKQKAQEEILQAYLRNPDSPRFNATQLEMLKGQVFGETLDNSLQAIKKLNETQQALVNARAAQAEKILNSDEATFQELLKDTNVTLNAEAIANRLIQQKYSDEQITTMLSSFTDEERRAVFEKVSDLNTRANAIVDNQAKTELAHEDKVERFTAYSTALDNLDKAHAKAAEEAIAQAKSKARAEGKSRAEIDSITSANDFVTEAEFTNTVQNFVSVNAAYEAQKAFDRASTNISFGSENVKPLPSNDALIMAINSYAHNQTKDDSKVKKAKINRDAELRAAGIYHKAAKETANIVGQNKTPSINEQSIQKMLEKNIRQEGIKFLKEHRPKALKGLKQSDTSAVAKAVKDSMIVTSALPDKLTHLINAYENQKVVNESISKAQENAFNASLRILAGSEAQYDLIIANASGEPDEIKRRQAQLKAAYAYAKSSFTGANKHSNLTDAQLNALAIDPTPIVNMIGAAIKRNLETAEDTIDKTKAKADVAKAELAAQAAKRNAQTATYATLDKEKRKAIENTDPASWDALKARIEFEAGTESFKDGRNFNTARNEGETPESISSTFTQTDSYVRAALARHLGKEQALHLLGRKRYAEIVDEVYTFIREEAKEKKQIDAYDNYLKAFKNAQEFNGIFTSTEEIENRTQSYAFAYSADHVEALENTLKHKCQVQENDPLAKAIENFAESSKGRALVGQMSTFTYRRDEALREAGFYNDMMQEVFYREGESEGILPTETISQRLDSVVRREALAKLKESLSKEEFDKLKNKQTSEIVTAAHEPDLDPVTGTPSRLRLLMNAYQSDKQLSTLGTEGVLDSLGDQFTTANGQKISPTKAGTGERKTFAELIEEATPKLDNPNDTFEDEVPNALPDNADIAMLINLKLQKAANKQLKRNASLHSDKTYLGETSIQGKALREIVSSFRKQRAILKNFTAEEQNAILSSNPKNARQFATAIMQVVGDSREIDGMPLSEATTKMSVAELRNAHKQNYQKKFQALAEKNGRIYGQKLERDLSEIIASATGIEGNINLEKQATLKAELEKLQADIESAETMPEGPDKVRALKDIQARSHDAKFGNFFKHNRKLSQIKDKIEKLEKKEASKASGTLQRADQIGLNAKRIQKLNQQIEDKKTKEREEAEAREAAAERAAEAAHEDGGDREGGSEAGDE